MMELSKDYPNCMIKIPASLIPPHIQRAFFFDKINIADTCITDFILYSNMTGNGSPFL
jgi:hypothetical protein